MIPEIAMTYLMLGFPFGITYPMIRDMMTDDPDIAFRKRGETGAELIGKMIGALFAWPIYFLGLAYYFANRFIIPWLTEPR